MNDLLEIIHRDYNLEILQKPRLTRLNKKEIEIGMTPIMYIKVRFYNSKSSTIRNIYESVENCLYDFIIDRIKRQKNQNYPLKLKKTKVSGRIINIQAFLMLDELDSYIFDLHRIDNNIIKKLCL